MSHINSGECTIRDLAALKAAAEELGCQYIEGKQTYHWYGRSMGDAPLPKGMTVDDLGKCSHVIAVPGVNYQVGVVKQKDGSHTLAYDYYGYDGSSHDGHKLLQKFGDKLCRLQQMYNKHAVLRAARAKGVAVHGKTRQNGSIQLQILT